MKSSDSQAPRATLSQTDAQLVDAIIESRALRVGSSEPRQWTDQERQRMPEVRNWLNLIGQWPVDDVPADLPQRTMARIQEARQRRRFAQQVETLAAPAPAFRWTELLAVAAVLMIGIGLLWPVLAQTRLDARKAACQLNLASAGTGLSLYTADHGGVLPRGATRSYDIWWDRPTSGVTAVQPNGPNLNLLITGHYVPAQALFCPEAPGPGAGGYSYINQDGAPIHLNSVPDRSIVGDRNPLYKASAIDADGLRYRTLLPDDSSSDLHQFRGQNVLTGDGNVIWLPRPYLGDSGRSIYQPMPSNQATTQPGQSGAYLAP